MSPGEKQGLAYKMPLFPLTSYFTLAFLVFVMVILGFSRYKNCSYRWSNLDRPVGSPVLCDRIE